MDDKLVSKYRGQGWKDDTKVKSIITVGQLRLCLSGLRELYRTTQLIVPDGDESEYMKAMMDMGEKIKKAISKATGNDDKKADPVIKPNPKMEYINKIKGDKDES